MSEAAIKLEGGCSCGAVRYEVRASLRDCGYCHCRMGQMASAAPQLVFASGRAGTHGATLPHLDRKRR